MTGYTEKEFCRALNAKVVSIVKEIELGMKERGMTWNDLSEKMGRPITKLGLKTELFCSDFRILIKIELALGETALGSRSSFEDEFISNPDNAVRIINARLKKIIKEEYRWAVSSHFTIRRIRLFWHQLYYMRKYGREYVRFALAELVEIFTPQRKAIWNDAWYVV